MKKKKTEDVHERVPEEEKLKHATVATCHPV
jgi:hypothetical protein